MDFSFSPDLNFSSVEDLSGASKWLNKDMADTISNALTRDISRRFVTV